MTNARKRASDEHHNNVAAKKSKARAQNVDTNDDETTNGTPNANKDSLQSTKAAANSGSESQPAAGGKAPTKRGRKFVQTVKETDTQITIVEENSSTSLTDVAAANQSQIQTNNKKKRRKRKLPNQPNQDAPKNADSRNVTTAASTSDEDEECSALNCIRPSGNAFSHSPFDSRANGCSVRETGREVDWVQCDGGCNEWFHMLCVGLIKSQVKPDDDFVCKKCKKTVPAATTTTAGGNSTTTATSTTAGTPTTTTTTLSTAINNSTRSSRKSNVVKIDSTVPNVVKKRSVRNLNNRDDKDTNSSEGNNTRELNKCDSENSNEQNMKNNIKNENTIST